MEFRQEHRPLAAERLFVGDSYAQDMQGAKRVGLKTAWLNHQREAHTTTDADLADYEIATLAELLEEPISAEYECRRTT